LQGRLVCRLLHSFLSRTVHKLGFSKKLGRSLESGLAQWYSSVFGINLMLLVHCFATRRYLKLLGGFWDPMLIQNKSHLCLIVPGKLVDMWSLSRSHGKEKAGRLSLSNDLPWYHFCVLMCHFQAYFCKASCNIV